MTDEEKTLLLKIDELYSALLREPNPIWNVTGLRPESNGFTYCRNAKLLQAKVNELWSKFRPDYLSDQEVRMLQHTCNKEVDNVDRAYELSRKSRTPKIRNKEFVESMDEANKRIGKDLYSLFKVIEVIKEPEN